MDRETRRALTVAVDAAKRRSLGLGDRSSHVRRYRPGSTSRRWTEAEIRRAVLKVSGGAPMKSGEYIRARKSLDPNSVPSYDTVKSRCPDLLT